MARNLWRAYYGRRGGSTRSSGSSAVEVEFSRNAVQGPGWSRMCRSASARYSQLVALGRSSTSSVTLAVCQNSEGLSQLVVLKTLSDARLQDSEARKGLLGEARLIARMNHPNVVKVHGLHYQGPLPSIVMEYLEGQSLATLLASAQERREFSLDLRIAIVVRVLRGLDYAHRLRDFNGQPLRVVHGGVSPGNVVITYDGEVKLIDFGRAQLQASGVGTQIERGSLPYLAPEQLRGEPDYRADIFSAGALLWELIVNRPLWDGIPAPTVLRRLLAGDMPSLHEVAPRADAALERICGRAIAPQADRRYRTAREMHEDLEKYLARRERFASDSALGALLRNVCREHRHETQRVIHARLSALGLSLTRSSADFTWSASSVWSAFATRLSRRQIAALAVAVALPVVLWFSLARHGASSASAESPISTFNALEKRDKSPPQWEFEIANPRATFPSRIKLDVNVTPRHAVLYLDGHRIPSNLLHTVLLWDPYAHTVRSEAPGFDPFTTTFRLDSDLSIYAALRPKAPEGEKPSDSRSQATPVSPLRIRNESVPPREGTRRWHNLPRMRH